MCIFHKWTKWEVYNATLYVRPLFTPEEVNQTRSVQRQQRTCKKCGLTQTTRLEVENN